MNKDCIFCNRESLKVLGETEHFFVIEDKFPVTKGHRLIIPKEHRADFFELTEDEQRDWVTLLNQSKEEIQKNDKTVTGFNIGMNCGESAGQTIFHCHIHLIPRRSEDIDDPTGGVRGVIPDKQKY